MKTLRVRAVKVFVTVVARSGWGSYLCHVSAIPSGRDELAFVTVVARSGWGS